MGDLQEQLSDLRRRMARIDRRFAAPTLPRLEPRPQPPPNPVHYFIDEWMSGQEVETPLGKHFETERLWERHRRHGSIGVDCLLEQPEDLLDSISENTVRPCPPAHWAFLDTETTGLAGGTGTYAFLVGVGRITPEGFRLRQFFMRDYGEEASMLHALAEHLAEFQVLVTYNAKAYDQPLLDTRYRLARVRQPFERLEHLDLLFGARRLWKLRFDSCRLVDLENQIFGIEREGDLPGEMIPYVYFEYVRTREAFRLAPIFHHNALDILTLACLTSIVPWAFRSPAEAPLSHGAEMVGLARWLRKAGQTEQALDMFRRATSAGLRDDLLFRTLWDTALLEKRHGRETAALPIFTELAGCPNPFRVPALEELAKYYEHGERNYAMALEFTEAALAAGETEALLRRQTRLTRRVSQPLLRR